MMVRSKIDIIICITFLIPLKLKANYTIQSFQSQYQYTSLNLKNVETR